MRGTLQLARLFFLTRIACHDTSPGALRPTFLVIVGLLIGHFQIARAVPIVWDGEADINWMNPVNWVGNVLPVPGTDDLHFAGSAKTNANNDFPLLSGFTGITFDAGARLRWEAIRSRSAAMSSTAPATCKRSI